MEVVSMKIGDDNAACVNRTSAPEAPAGAAGRPVVKNHRRIAITFLDSFRVSASVLAILVVLLGCSSCLTLINGQQPASAARHSIGVWEEDIGYYQSLSVSADSPILHHVSDYQSIEVFVSKYYGKILMLDNVVQLTERDADSYNEMMAQMPMMQHKNPKRALIIGGGDGYILSEVRTIHNTAICNLQSAICNLQSAISANVYH